LGRGSASHSTSSKIVDVVTPADVTQQVNTFQVELKARMQGGAFLFDQTYNAALSDPTVQAAITQAESVLTAAGAASFAGPTQLSSTSSTTSASSTANTTTATNVTLSVTTYIGPQTIFVGDNQSMPLSIVPGGQDIDTLYTEELFITQTTTTTNTTLTSQVYEIDGVPAGPAPTVTSVVNGYNASSPLSSGVVAAVSGSNFGTIAANLSVMVGGKAAYVYPASVTPTQIQIEIPTELIAGPTTLTVTVSGAASAPFSITLVAYSPACQPQSGSTLGQVLTSASQIVTLTSPAHPGDPLTAAFTGLGPTTPPTPTGLAAAANPTPALPTLSIGGVAAHVNSAAVAPGAAGVYQISFTVPAGVQSTQALVLSIGGVSSSTSCTIALAGLSSVVNNASFANPGTASPGSIATAFVNSLGTTTDELSALFASTKSEGVQLAFGNTPAPMFHIVASTAQQQVDLLVPTNLPTTGTVNVQLSTGSTTYPNYTLNMVPANPGFYRIADPKVAGRFNIIAQVANTTWLALPVSTAATLGLPACTAGTDALTECGQPATIGDYLVIYVTGLGLATPLSTGQVAPVNANPLYKTPTLPVVTIGGVPATVLFSGLAPGFSGLYQLDIQVPPGVANGDDVPVKVTMLGASDTATVSVQPRSN
jgi:uncharacterized protein (TIGR03437 family)